MSLNVEQTHDRTGRPVAALHTAAAQDDSQVCHETDTHNVDDEVLRKRMEKSIHDENHETDDGERGRHGLPNSRTTTFVVKYAQSTSVRKLIQKLRTTQIDMLFKKIYNQSFNPFSPESKQMIRDVGNIELCELLETEPKPQCKACLSYWNIGILCCTCGYFLHKKKRSESAIHQFYDGHSFSSGVRHQERTTSRTSIW